MGTTRAGSKRNIIAVAFVSAFVLFAPVVVFAQEAPQPEQKCSENIKQPKCKPVCWRKEQCDKESGKENARGSWEQNKESDATCGGNPWGYCYPPNIETKLQIPIGEARDVADVGQYIKIIYLFLLGIGGLVGAIVLIHAGFLWMASGGNTTSVERAKKHIQDAAIGLLLLFGSYTILSAINPDLVKLRVPKAQLLRNVALEFEPQKAGKVGGECNIADDRSKNECAAACDGCKCIEFDNAMVTLAQWVSWGAVAAAASTMFAGTAVAQVGIKALGWGGKSVKFVASKLFGLCTTGLPIAAICAYGAGATADDVIAKLTGKGVCIPPASNLEKGAMCAFNENCKSGKCIGGSTEEHLGLIGFCGDGTEGSPCEADADCVGVPADGVCATGPLDTKWCTTRANRQKGSPCEAVEEGDQVRSECAAGLGCKVVDPAVWTFSTKEGVGWCVGEREAAGGPPKYVGDICSGVDCPAGFLCRAWEFGKAENCNNVCDSNEFCAAACPPGEQCYCGDASPRICVKGARVAVAPAPVEVLQNGGAGCDNQAARRCADGLRCVGPIEALPSAIDGHAQSVCSDGANGSWCSNFVNPQECASKFCSNVQVDAQGNNVTKCAACRNNEDCFQGACQQGVCR